MQYPREAFVKAIHRTARLNDGAEWRANDPIGPTDGFGFGWGQGLLDQGGGGGYGFYGGNGSGPGNDPLPITNDECRRTDRLLRCAGCVGGFECPVHGTRL